MCFEKSKISIIVTAYFLAFSCAGLCLFTFPDKLGCKKTHRIFGTIHFIAQFTIIFSSNYWVRMFSFGLMGASQLKNSSSYMWLFGLNRRKDSSISCGLLNSWDNLTLAVMSIYFMFLNKHWFNICMIMSCSGLVSHLFM